MFVERTNYYAKPGRAADVLVVALGGCDKKSDSGGEGATATASGSSGHPVWGDYDLSKKLDILQGKKIMKLHAPSLIKSEGMRKLQEDMVFEVKGAEVTVTAEGSGLLPPSVHIALYRIAQEALNNVAKHAAAGHVEVHFCGEPERATLKVQDDGRGARELPQGLRPDRALLPRALRRGAARDGRVRRLGVPGGGTATGRRVAARGGRLLRRRLDRRGAALVQDGSWSPAAVWVAIPAFLMTFNLLLLNEFPDYQADKSVGKKTLVVALGREQAGGLGRVLQSVRRPPPRQPQERGALGRVDAGLSQLRRASDGARSFTAHDRGDSRATRARSPNGRAPHRQARHARISARAPHRRARCCRGKAFRP